MLLPLFAMRALADRDKGRTLQLAILAAGAAVQLLLFYRTSPMRGHLLDPGVLAAVMLVRLLALPIFGLNVAGRFGTLIYLSHAHGGGGWWAAVALSMTLFGVLIVQATSRRDAAIWLLLASISIAAVSFGFGMLVSDPAVPFDPAAGERYDFLPLVLLGLGLIALAMRKRFAGRSSHAVLCLVMLCTSALHYRAPAAIFSDGPSWPAEVQAWRHDHRHAVEVWPGNWTADLSDQTHPCLPPGHDSGAPAGPGYCESGWAFGLARPPQGR